MLFRKRRNVQELESLRNHDNGYNTSCRINCNSNNYKQISKIIHSKLDGQLSLSIPKSPEKGYLFTYPKLLTQRCYLGHMDDDCYEGNKQVMFGESEIHHILRLQLAHYNRFKNSSSFKSNLQVPKIGIPRRKAQLIRRRQRLFLSSGETKLPFQPDFLSFEGVKKKYSPKEEIPYTLEHVRYLFPCTNTYESPPQFTLESVRYLFKENEENLSRPECLLEGFAEIFVPIEKRRKVEVIETVDLLDKALHEACNIFSVKFPDEFVFRLLTPVSKDVEIQLVQAGYRYEFDRKNDLPCLPVPTLVESKSSVLEIASRTSFMKQLWKTYLSSKSKRFEYRQLKELGEIEELKEIKHTEDLETAKKELNDLAQHEIVDDFTLPFVTDLMRGKIISNSNSFRHRKPYNEKKEPNLDAVSGNLSLWKVKLGCKIEQLRHLKIRKGP